MIDLEKINQSCLSHEACSVKFNIISGKNSLERYGNVFLSCACYYQ